MRLLVLPGALLFFAFAVTAAVASQETYRQVLGNDGLWGQGRWGAIVDPNDNRRVVEYIVDDRAKGRAFMIRTLVVGATGLTGLFLLVTWINHRRRPASPDATTESSPAST